MAITADQLSNQADN